MNTSSNIPVVKSLELDKLPAGSEQRFWVHIVSSGLAQKILVPVLVAKGAEPGPVLGLTAAIHGNELNGLPIVRKVMQMIDIQKLKGTVVGIPVLNVPGFLQNQRYFNDGIDLNRVMPGKADGDTSQVYAHRLLKKLIRPFEYLIDVHTASFGRINSYYIRADMNQEVTARMASLQNAEIIVNNEGADGTLRAAAGELGIHSITIEAGDPNKFQKGMIRSAITGIHNVLGDLGMTDDPIISPEEPAVLCKRSYWLYSNAGGILEVFPDITDFVEEGEKIAVVRDLFGDQIREYFAPERGIVVGKSINPVNQTGARILHLGIPK